MPDNAEPGDQKQVETDVDEQRNAGGVNGRARILAREKSGDQNLDQHIGGQSDHKCRDDLRGGLTISRLEIPAHVKGGDQRTGGKEQGEGGRDGEQHGQLNRICSECAGLRPGHPAQ